MLSDWQKTTVGALCARVCSGGTPKSSNSEFYATCGIPWLNTKEIDFNRVRSTEKHITEAGFNASAAKWVDVNSVIVAMYGATAGKCCINKIPLTTNQACCNLTVNPELCDYRFLYFYLCDKYRELALLANGGAQQNLNAQIIKNFEIDLPPLETQRKIAAILSALDDKIELNRRINANLEQQAAAIFDSWLIRNIESGKTVSLDEVCAKVTDGSHFSPKDDSSSSIPMFSVKDMERYDFDFKSCKHISDADFEKMVANDCVPRINDILVAKDGSYLKEIFICNEARKIAVLSSIAIFRPNLERVIPEILLAFLKSPAILKIVRENFVSGSALPRIVLKDFKKLKFMLPDVEKQSEIAPLLAVFRRQIGNNVMENVRLNILRDAALPRLMSGEIDVSDVSL